MFLKKQKDILCEKALESRKEYVKALAAQKIKRCTM